MDFQSFERVIVAKTSGRVDHVLQQIKYDDWKWLSRKAWDILIQNNKVGKENGQVFCSSDYIEVGTKIRIILPVQRLGFQRMNTRISPEILKYMHPSKEWGIFIKPPGLASYSLLPWDNKSFANAVAQFLEEQNIISMEQFSQLAQAPILEGGFVQRLDFGTSGLMIVAFTKEIKEKFKLSFAKKMFSKTYYCIVTGKTNFYKKTNDYKIVLNQSAKKVKVLKTPYVTREQKIFPITVTLQTLANGANCSLVKLTTLAGIRHQVRAVLSAEGHALLGDKLYQSPEEQDANSAEFPHYFLHAYSLQMQGHDEVSCEPPPVFLAALKKLGILKW